MAKGLCVICCANPKDRLTKPGMVVTVITNTGKQESRITYKPCEACKGKGWVDFK